MNYEAELEEKWEKWHTNQEILDIASLNAQQHKMLDARLRSRKRPAVVVEEWGIPMLTEERQEPRPGFLIVLGVILLLGASVWAFCGFVGVEK